MTARKITTHSFSAASKLYAASPDGLAALLRGICIDNARIAIAVSSMTDFVDNTTGTATVLKNVVVPTAAVDSSSLTVGSPRAALNTALGLTANGIAVLAQQINLARARLGLTALTDSTGGTVAVAGTIPAQTKALAATTGNLCATWTSAATSLGVARANVYKLGLALNEVLVAMGIAPLTNQMTGSITALTTLSVIPATALSSTGADAAGDTVVDAALTALADDMAAIAATWNTAMAGASTATTPLNVIAG